MLHALFLQVAPAFLYATGLGLVALAAWVSSLVAKHIRDKRYGAAVTLLAYGAAGVVADLEQHVVVALKDPAKAGKWTEIAAGAVRVRGVELLRKLYPLAVGFITQVLRDPKQVDTLLGTLLERAVLDLKAKVPARLPAPPAETLNSLAEDPVLLGRSTVVPPEPIAPANESGGR